MTNDANEAERFPRIVSRTEWEAARLNLMAKEKAHMRAGDTLAAERRRLPMVKVDKEYVFDGPDGNATLLDLFQGRRQLILYHFMFDPTWDAGCEGCSMLVDGIGHLAHLHARDVALVLVSRAPQTKLEPFRRRMAWTVPWYSSFGNEFNVDFDMTRDGEEKSGTSVFLRDGRHIYRTYFTNNRGDESYMSTWKMLDLTPFGRQETWEDSPEGWPQTPPYEWWRHHDSYVSVPTSSTCCSQLDRRDP
jgi:predicted dithiol-disulfide oxidoreductase (DUF899 family)